MTREEAIKILSNHEMIDVMWDKADEALNMAIDALEQEPCEDCISRQAVLEWIKGSVGQYANTYSIDMLNMWMLFEEQIKAMPSVPLKPNTDVFDKIRAEIKDTGAYEQEVNGKTEFLKGINYCLGVIDKYKAESEDKE